MLKMVVLPISAVSGLGQLKKKKSEQKTAGVRKIGRLEGRIAQ